MPLRDNEHARFRPLSNVPSNLKGTYETSSTLGLMDSPSDPTGSNCPTTGHLHWALLSDFSEEINSDPLKKLPHS